MSRHSRQACARGAGFSFVELLVTIVIAGIAFAAMVPVFVQASQKSAADAARQQAANVAQDKVEKIRQLSFGDITVPNLSRPIDPVNPAVNFADGQFGPSTELSTGSGQRVIYTDYAVDVFPATATGMDPQYKVVSVTAYWTGSPKPVKRVVLQTIIYRQYAAPPIIEFSTNPVIDVTGVLGDENLVSATLAAKVDLTAGIAPAYVQFTISAYGGRTVASQVVDAGNTNPFLGYWYDRGTFYWTWDCSTAANTLYDFQVTAYSSEDYAGNTMHLYPRIQHTLLPLPPGNVVATAGDGAVYVRWGMSPDPNLAHYAVYRTTSAVGWGAAKLVEEVAAPATFFLDRDPTLVNGTEYYYAVVAVMLDAGRSARSVSGPVTPQDSADTTGPVAPSFINATPASAAATVALTWGAPTDLDVWAYEVWRSADGNDWGPSPLAVWTNLATLSYSDSSAGWNTTWHYRIRALDGTLNEGAWSATASATTVPQPFHDLRISVQNGNHACNVWVLNAADQHYYNATGVRQDSTPPGVPIARNSSVTFTHLPDGAYTVYASTGSLPGTVTFGAQVQDPFGDLTGVSP